MTTDNKLMPDSCSSLHCSPPQSYCTDCSHALWFGEVIVYGVVWRFEFSPRFGPTFTRKDGEPKTNQPPENHPVWDKWQEWYDDKFRNTRQGEAMTTDNELMPDNEECKPVRARYQEICTFCGGTHRTLDHYKNDYTKTTRQGEGDG